MAKDDDLRKQIQRANTAKELAEARTEYVRLLEQDDWQVTERALRDAKPILKTLGITYPTECALVDAILEKLKDDHPLKAIGMGEPPGIHGIAHVMKGAYFEDVYIKIKIEDDKVFVLSFHR